MKMRRRKNNKSRPQPNQPLLEERVNLARIKRKTAALDLTERLRLVENDIQSRQISATKHSDPKKKKTRQQIRKLTVLQKRLTTIRHLITQANKDQH
jgi:hypothetical protein